MQKGFGGGIVFGCEITWFECSNTLLQVLYKVKQVRSNVLEYLENK